MNATWIGRENFRAPVTSRWVLNRRGHRFGGVPTRWVLLVDGNAAAAVSLAGLDFGERVSTRTATSVTTAVAMLESDPVDVVVLDVDSTGVATALAETVQRFDVPVIAIGEPGIRSAIDAVRAGAADYIERPCDPEELRRAVGKAFAAAERDAAEPATPAPARSGFLGESREMRQVGEAVDRVAQGNATVLVRGETGTGKELVARAVHARSSRAEGPFVKVHCAGLPDTLLESELFGYEKGAFTGAVTSKPGRVELAEGGTLFLDEIGDINPLMQVKLLRLLQDREYERLGGTKTIRANVRFVSATHRPLEKMVRAGDFREDLFYRLNVVPVWLPPLRARREDIGLLARHFCTAFAAEHRRPGFGMTDAAIAALQAERWPGNVRQLQNLVERLVVMTAGNAIDAADVRRELSPEVTFATRTGVSAVRPPSAVDSTSGQLIPLDDVLRAAERRAIERALHHAKGNRALAARLLGTSRANLYNKLDEYGLAKTDVR